MMKSLHLIILFFVFCASFTANSEQSKGTLKLEIYGFPSDEGTARILIFTESQKDKFPSDRNSAAIKKIVPIKNKQVIIEFKDLAYGYYAISVHHDINNDGKVNTNWLKIPKEPLGSSNDAKGFLGPPSFDKAKINLDRNYLTAKINMVIP